MQSLEKTDYKRKLESNLDFQEGKKIFLEKKVTENQPVKFKWYKKIVSKQEFNQRYQYSNYCILFSTKEQIEFAYMSVSDSGDLEIIDIEQLRQIDNFLRARNLRPFIFEDKN